MAKKIGLFGGTFNPIHIGHLRSAIEAIELLSLDELRLMPNAIPPHREVPKVSAERRLDMVKLASSGIAKLCVDDRELKRCTPSYTIDTLLSIRDELSAKDQLFFIMGWDAFCGLPTWQRWQELLTYCHIIVLQRPPVSAKIPPELQHYLKGKLVANIKDLIPVSGQVVYLQQTLLDISSTQIRQYIAQDKSVRFLLSDSVLDYINQHQLYQNL